MRARYARRVILMKMGDPRDDRRTEVPAFDLDAYAREEDMRASHLRPKPEVSATPVIDAPPEPPRSGPFPRPPSLPRIPGVTPATLEDAARARLGPLHRVPRLTKLVSELRDQIDDPTTAFVVGFVDGLLPLEAILDASGIPEADVVRILDALLTKGVIALGDGVRRSR